VALKQVAPETLASRLVAGLHFAGEVLDLDGPCGGYNLHWCLASGRLAGACCLRDAPPTAIAPQRVKGPDDEG
jgi:predicted flavoprotein YhiN